MKLFNYFLFFVILLFSIVIVQADSGILDVEVNITGNCTPDFYCSLYSGCNISNINTCVEVSDMNICEEFSGNTEDYNGVCDYCIPVWSDITNCNNEYVTIIYNSNCCDETGLESDCITIPIDNGSIRRCEYNISDITGLVVDGVGKAGVTIKDLIAIIVIGFIIIGGAVGINLLIRYGGLRK